MGVTPTLAAYQSVAEARAVLEANGYVVLKEKSYRQAQERQRVADVFRAHAEEDAEHARAWARDCLTEERRLRDRLTFVYGIAQAHGATVEDLRSPTDAREAPDEVVAALGVATTQTEVDPMVRHEAHQKVLAYLRGTDG